MKTVMPMLGAALLLAVGACATVGAPMAQAPTSQAPNAQAFKTVGVISAIGDELTLTKAGLTGLDSGNTSFPIEPWGIDDLIVGRTRALLSKRFQVQPVTYRRAVFAAREPASPITVINLLRDDPIKELVRTEAAPQGLDAYVVITKATTEYGNRGRTIAGVGIVKHDAALGSYAQLHALYVIRVIDGHDFKVIDKRSASPPDNAEMNRLPGPSRMVAAALVPTGDAAHDGKLKAAVTELIERSLEPTLRDLRLVDGSST
jgi:hypothetical protein